MRPFLRPQKQIMGWSFFVQYCTWASLVLRDIRGFQTVICGLLAMRERIFGDILK